MFMSNFIIKILTYNQNFLFLITLAIALFSSKNIAHADEISYRIIVNYCYSCHGPQGQGAENIPSINRMDAKQLKRQLKAFRDGKQESTIMQRLTKSLTNDEINKISIYISKNEQ